MYQIFWKLLQFAHSREEHVLRRKYSFDFVSLYRHGGHLKVFKLLIFDCRIVNDIFFYLLVEELVRVELGHVEVDLGVHIGFAASDKRNSARSESYLVSL